VRCADMRDESVRLVVDGTDAGAGAKEGAGE
jgi:hypothetical protein